MANPECTPISPEEERELMGAFPLFLEEGEENMARKFFTQYVFFRTVEPATRRCVCTSCMEGFFVHKETSPDFFRVRHKGSCECPSCGARATLMAVGKFSSFNSLDERQRAVQLSVHGDWLLVQAGYVIRRFHPEDLGGDIEFEPFKRYAFAPGRRVMWSARTYSWFGRYWHAEGPFVPEQRIQDPFQTLPYEREASYVLLGAERIAASSMRYCQYGEWFDDEFGGLLGDLDWEDEPFRVARLIRYLAEYTRRPQMELLVKLGFYKVVSDLILRRKPHGDILDWNASNPADFFRLSRGDFRTLRQEGMDGYEDLKRFRRLQKAGLVKDLREFIREKRRMEKNFDQVCKCAALANVSLERAVNYALSFGQNYAVMVQIWLDYLEAAARLKYDLARDDVRLPRDLPERHDHAVAAAATVTNEQAMKRYAARFARLTAQFAFELDGLAVRVPRCAEEIVQEGKLLRHCVGGYADRHMDGRVTILFLRKLDAPSVPYVTIEMTTENNCKQLQIRQIHGYRNERDGAPPPEAVHKDFLETWLDWVHAGSPRDAEGRPAAPERTRVEVA